MNDAPLHSASTHSATGQLAMFAKYWLPGSVKTRLASEVGAEAAARLYRTFVETLLNRLRPFPAELQLVFSPAEAEKSFAACAAVNGWHLKAQSSGDLGERMRLFFQQAFAAGHRQVVLIGSDSPDLPIAVLEEAFQALKTHPVALGPSADGGYYLIGASEPIPELFEQIPWSTPRVWPETIARLKKLACRYHELPAWYDVDDLAGLQRLQAQTHDSSDPWLRKLSVDVSSCLECARP